LAYIFETISAMAIKESIKFKAEFQKLTGIICATPFCTLVLQLFVEDDIFGYIYWLRFISSVVLLLFGRYYWNLGYTLLIEAEKEE